MFQVDADASAQLLTISFLQRVDPEQMRRCVQDTRSALAGMKPGFRLLTDLTSLETMELACAAYVEEIMELCDEKKVQTVLRVIPDPKKDIGFNIMSQFHYAPTVRQQTYNTLSEARQDL